MRHRFADADGTELDGANGAGRFRVLLQAEDDQGRQDWASRRLGRRGAVARRHRNCRRPNTRPRWHVYPGAWTELPDLSKETAVFEGESPGIQQTPTALPATPTAWDGFIDVPADGGYTFHLMSRDGARLVIDGMQVAKTGPPFAQVCGSPGNAVRYSRGSIGLRAGPHLLHLEGLHFASQGAPRLLWEGPGIRLTEIPPGAFVHPSVNIRSSDQPSGLADPRPIVPALVKASPSAGP